MALKFLFPKMNCQYFTYICIFAKSLQLCPTLCDPIDSSPPGSPCPWDSPGKNTGVGCHFLLQCMKVKSESEVAQSYLTFSDPMDCSLQAPPSMGFSRQEYWSGLPLPSPYVYLSVCKCVCVYIYIYIYWITSKYFFHNFFSYSQLNISIKGGQGFFIFSWGNLFYVECCKISDALKTVISDLLNT